MISSTSGITNYSYRPASRALILGMAIVSAVGIVLVLTALTLLSVSASLFKANFVITELIAVGFSASSLGLIYASRLYLRRRRFITSALTFANNFEEIIEHSKDPSHEDMLSLEGYISTARQWRDELVRSRSIYVAERLQKIILRFEDKAS